MSNDINKVVLTARLTRDPDMRATPAGTSILNLGIAFNDRRRNSQTGEWEEVGNFADATLFGSRAEPLSGMLHKGSRVALEGRLRYSSWERDGQKRSKLDIIVDEIVLLDPKGGEPQKRPGYGVAKQYAQYRQEVEQEREPEPEPEQQQLPDYDPGAFDKDIPFGG